MRTQTGIIFQAKSGFYSIWSNGETYISKPKGLFRHHQQSPLVGDIVTFEYDEKHPESESRLIEIKERANEFIRPSIANVDEALIVMSLVEPDFSEILLDYYLVNAEQYGVKCQIILSKYDLLIDRVGQLAAQAQVEHIQSVYTQIGYPVEVFDNSQQTAQRIRANIHEGLYVVMGQSGVGKSTLLNALIPTAQIDTRPISDALNRGRHTTREVTLYPINQGLIADTPGFSAIDFDQIEVESLAHYFPEIDEAALHCKFRSCLHLKEPGCYVKEQVENQKISKSRYESYLSIAQRIMQRKPKYLRKNK
ncbi:ribosome small subunit-dependent GTPase A [Falseniella ignava]|uniref:Small ribosomal subunit biogenesis GTPase RsgA n=1 Tax=Falseniella ignava TaxID=137730 RepID=A0A2I1K422_9LACT|nr:ribosome small subunit-dependent GTPase A [Falseniella ignava]PKY90400.1 ribosome small subunit-dependent GTPase A [Falseniella ignava]